MKNVRSSQPCISMDSLKNKFFHVSIVGLIEKYIDNGLIILKMAFSLTLSYICIAIYYEHKLQEINMNKWCFFPKTILCQYNNCIFQRRLKELFLLPVKTVIRRILSHSEVISRYKHFRMVNYTSRSVYKHDIS